MSGWQGSLQVFLKTFGEILTAGIAITAFSLLLYALAFNLRERVARSFALILISTVVVYTAEAIASIENSPVALEFWVRLQWVGIAFLPAAYMHFSDALLATTGRPSRWRRRWVTRLFYLASLSFIMGLPFPWLIGPVVYGNPPAPHLQPTFFTNLFILYYVVAMAISWINFVRAYRRTTTTASRRRMFYLIAGAVAPALGAFPFLPYSPDFAASHQLTFWSLAVISNLFVGMLLVVMAYAVAFFGVSWPDRIVKARLLEWLLRGPFTASLTLTATTLTRRTGEAFGSTYSAMVPIVMAGTILLSEYLITILVPLGERLLFYGKDKSELELLRSLENHLVTPGDLHQFLEMVLATASDRLQAKGAYLVALVEDGPELVVSTGRTRFNEKEAESHLTDELLQIVVEDGQPEPRIFRWSEDYLFPLMNGTPEQPELIGLLGVCGVSRDPLDEEQSQAMDTLTGRATLALQNRRIQEKVFPALETLSTRTDLIQRLRAAGQYDRHSLLADDESLPRESDLSIWVKEALSHYWGGPKLTQSPLMGYRIVQEALAEHGGNPTNAMRAVLRRAIDRIRPEGERRFTAEWILYNILEMKFVEGRKVREVALRLAMSEADLYRKQRIAVEAVARAIGEMEVQARKEAGS